MATLTTNYQLKKPDASDSVSIADINDNMDIIDNQMKTNATHASDTTKHITSEERTTWNSKTDDTTVNAHKSDTTVHITASERSAWNAKLNQSGGTMTGALVAQTNTDYATAQMRNVIISTSDPSGGSSGDIWIKYA